MNHEVKTFNDLSVLAVDDLEAARKLVHTMLKDLGVKQVFSAADGKEALDFLGEYESVIDVIICDWNMPRVTGLEILRQVRTVNPDIPFLMATGNSDAESVKIAKADGVTGYLIKPFSMAQLEKKLKLVLRILKTRKPALKITAGNGD